MDRPVCPWCVKVTCQHITMRSGERTWPCEWSGYRPRAKARTHCPWCMTKGAFTVRAVRHRLSHVCVHKPKGS